MKRFAALLFALTTTSALAGNFCAVRPDRTQVCTYTTLDACTQALIDIHDQCIPNPEVLPPRTPPPEGAIAPARVTTLPLPPPALGPQTYDSWRRGVDVGQQIRDEQSQIPGINSPYPRAQPTTVLVLYQCPAPGGGVSYSGSPGAGCVLVHVITN